MHRVSLVDFRAEDVERIEPWFDDQETQVRLGGRDWIRREPSFLWLTVGGEFRGKIVTGRRMWLSLDESGEPVAFVDGEMYDRYAAWDGSDWDHPSSRMSLRRRRWASPWSSIPPDDDVDTGPQHFRPSSSTRPCHTYGCSSAGSSTTTSRRSRV